MQRTELDHLVALVDQVVEAWRSRSARLGCALSCVGTLSGLAPAGTSELVHLDDLAYENARANAESVGVPLAEVLPHHRQLLGEDAQHALPNEYGSDCASCNWTIGRTSPVCPGQHAVVFCTAVNIRNQAHESSYSPMEPSWFGAINPWKGFRAGPRRRIEAGPGLSQRWPRPPAWGGSPGCCAGNVAFP